MTSLVWWHHKRFQVQGHRPAIVAPGVDYLHANLLVFSTTYGWPTHQISAINFKFSLHIQHWFLVCIRPGVQASHGEQPLREVGSVERLHFQTSAPSIFSSKIARVWILHPLIQEIYKYETNINPDASHLSFPLTRIRRFETSETNGSICKAMSCCIWCITSNQREARLGGPGWIDQCKDWCFIETDLHCVNQPGNANVVPAQATYRSVCKNAIWSSMIKEL